MKNISDKIALTLFCLAMLGGALVYGYFAHIRHWFPHEIIKQAIEIYHSPALFGKPHHLFPIRYNKSGAIIHKQAMISPGVTLVTGYWKDKDWKPGVKLLDVKGETLHYWPVDPTGVWKEGVPYQDHMAGKMNFETNYVHGSYLHANGDLVINIEYLGLFKLDKCGTVKWRLPYRTHHSISVDDEGNYWVSGLKWIEPGDKRAESFPGLITPFVEETAIKVSPDGKILKEISILESLYMQGYKYLFWKYVNREGDITHLNDVEPLSEKVADQYPGYIPGDLAVSLRNLSTVLIMDQEGKIKWYDSQTNINQHDPDFEGNGWLTIYDNRNDWSNEGIWLESSRLVAINVVTNESKTIYPTESSQHFYSNAGGKHQLLENGNRLITEARAGRIFEISPTGELLWEWINEPFDSVDVAEVLEGTRYNISKEIISQWQCIE